MLGTPSDLKWPGVTLLKHWKSVFPSWDDVKLHKVVPQIGAEGLDLLTQMLKYSPQHRISCTDGNDYFLVCLLCVCGSEAIECMVDINTSQSIFW